MKASMTSKFIMATAVVWAVGGAPWGAQADFAAAVSALGPVAYYRFSTTDQVPAEVPAVNSGALGAACNGEYVGTPDRALAGALVGDANTAVGVSGGSKRVVVPFKPEYNPEGPFTVEAWLNPASDAAGLTAPLNAAQMVGSRSGWLLYQNGPDAWSFRMYNQNGTAFSVELAGGGPVEVGKWYHIVAVYDGTDATLYVNGQVAVTGTPAGTPKAYVANVDGPFVIGARSDFAYPWVGLADEVAIYTTALTEADVRAHYENGINPARTTPYDTLVKAKNPALYFRLDEPPLALPVAENIGSWGMVANGLYLPGTTPGVAGPQHPAFTGFEPTNHAVYFNGVSGLVRVPGQPLITDTATFLCWVKRDGNNPTRAGIMHNRGPNTLATGLGLQDAGNALSYNWEDHGEAYNFNPGFVLPDQGWALVGVSVQPDYAILFMGSSAGLQAATNNYYHEPHDFSGAPLEFGIDNYQPTRVFKGAIDEFAMFDQALDLETISNLFYAALPAVTLATRTPADPIYEGMTVTFTAAAASKLPMTYQWRRNGQPLTGKTSPTLVLSNVQTADSGDYEVAVTSGGTTVTSPALPLTVSAGPPIFVRQPVSAVRCAGANVTFEAVVYGSQPVTYQWKHGEAAVPGAAAPALRLTEVQAADAGDYVLVASNAYGTMESTKATLTVQPVSNTYEGTVVAYGPINYWRLNETGGATAADLVGGANATHASVATGANGPQAPQFAGLEGQNLAAAYDGTKAGTTTGASLMNHLQQFTLMGWIKLADTQPAGGRIGFFGQNDVAEFGFHDAQAGIWTANGGGVVGIPTADFLPGQWYFVAAVGDGATLTFYLDGEPAATGGNPTGDYGNSTSPFNIGYAVLDPSGNFLNGTIDEVALFDKALTAGQIKYLHTLAVGGATAPQIVAPPASQTVLAGDAVALTVEVTGGAPYNYQWKKDGADLTGATKQSLRIASAALSDSGTYTVSVSNNVGSQNSPPATLTVVPVPTYCNLTNSLVLHLKFDGDLNDASGRGNHGTAVGEPTFVPGKIGPQALHYNTETDVAYNYVTLGTPADLDLGTDVNFSVAFWTKFTGSPGDLPFLANNNNSMGDVGVTIAPSYNEGGWSWGLNDALEPKAWPGIGLYDPVGNTLNDGNWHHLVHTFDRAGNGTTYLDGVQVHTMPITAAAGWDLTTGLPWNIGQGSGAYPETGVFEMDDLGFWRRPLANYEARSIYIVGQNYGRTFDQPGPTTVTLTIKRVGAELELTWATGTLEAADRITGPWAAVSGAAAPSYKLTPTGAAKFYRVKL